MMLDERYPDLLGGCDDPDTVRLVTDLDRACAATTAPRAALLDAALEEVLRRRGATRLNPTPMSRRHGLARSRRPLLLAAVAILGLVAVGGASATGTLVDRLFSLFVNHDQQAAWTDQGIDLHLTQTACGRTMTLQHAYADANRIIIGYTLSGTGPALAPHLSTANGMQPPALDAGSSGRSWGGMSSNVITFDAVHIARRPGRLDLRLTAAAGGAATCSRTFDFRFAVPFVLGRTLTLNQTIVSEGIAVTLDRVVVTPMETRVYVHTIGKPINEPYLADLTVGGRALESGFNGWTSPMRHVVSDVFSFRSIAAEHGAATLTLSWPRIAVGVLPKAQSTSGPWTFHFTVP